MNLKFKDFLSQTSSVWITTLGVSVFVTALRYAGVFQGLEWKSHDFYLQLVPSQKKEQYSDIIRVVGINEDDVKKLKESILPDKTLAQLLEKIKSMNPRAIGLDIYRNIPEPPGTETLEQVFKTTPNLIGIEKIVGKKGEQAVDPPPVLKSKDQVCSNDLIIDSDNIIRRALLNLSDDKKQTIYSFAACLAFLYLEKEKVPFKPSNGNFQIGKSIFTPLGSNDAGYIRADNGGFQFLIDYRGGRKNFKTVSMSDILEGKVPSNWGKDRIVLIGKIGESFKDFYFTPYSGLIGLSEGIPGTEIHATITHQLIKAALSGKAQIETWPEWVKELWIFIWSAIGATIGWQSRYKEGKKNSAWLTGSSFILAISFLLSTGYFALILGWWIPVIPPFAGLSLSAILITWQIARSAGKIRQIFGRYITDQVVAKILENPAGLNMGGEKKELTLLVSDLRGFTTIAESISPEEAIKVLNFYFESMVDVITKYQGTIDEFMGDGILVLFGAPITKENDPERALACAIEMQLAITQVNEQIKQWGHSSLAMGIGINTGEAIVGNIGSEKRTKYGVVGSQVNLTYRIESQTLGGQIVIAQTTLDKIQKNTPVVIKEVKQVNLKGIKEPVSIYNIAGIEGNYNLYLPEQKKENFVQLPKPIPVQYRILVEKKIEDIVFTGFLVSLSISEAKIIPSDQQEITIAPQSANIKLTFYETGNIILDNQDTYAKVVDVKVENNVNFFYIYFTSRSSEVESELNALYQKYYEI